MLSDFLRIIGSQTANLRRPRGNAGTPRAGRRCGTDGGGLAARAVHDHGAGNENGAAQAEEVTKLEQAIGLDLILLG
jgi:hypothetical protein